MVSDRTVLPPICCLGFVGYRSWSKINDLCCMFALSTLPKRTTPLTEHSPKKYSPVLAYHRIWHRSFVNSAYEHACGLATGVFGVVRSGIGPSPRVRARPPLVQHLLRGGFNRGLLAFQGGQRHHGRFGAPEKEKRAGGSNYRRASPGDAALGHALR